MRSLLLVLLLSAVGFCQEPIPQSVLAPTPATVLAPTIEMPPPVKPPSLKDNEDAWTDYIVKSQLFGATVRQRTFDGRWCDIVWVGRAIEVDWARKWAEGIGQSAGYANALGLQPVVLLLRRDSSDDLHINRALGAAGVYRVPVWVYDIKAKKFTRRGPQNPGGCCGPTYYPVLTPTQAPK